MKRFKTREQLVNAKAILTLKSFAYDQIEAIDWTISGLRKEIIKERNYINKKVGIQFHPYSAKLENVPVGCEYIKNFGYVQA